MKRLIYCIPLFILASISFIGCKKNNNTATYPNFDEFIQSQPNLTTFSQALDKAQLQNFKTGPGPFTWFAPTNAAFSAAGISIDQMTAGQLSYILLYHLINATSDLQPVTTKDMYATTSFPRTTQMGSSVYFGQYKDSFYVNGSAIINPNNRLSNGYIHILNRLNIPPNLRGNNQSILNATGQHTLFIAALMKAIPTGSTTSRWAQLASSTFTLLAPTDAAMTAAGYTTTSINAAPAAQIDSLVRYHMFSGSRFFTNDFASVPTQPTFLGTAATVQFSNNGRSVAGRKNSSPVGIITPDLLGTTGVVHIINGLLRY
ncbi:MAG: fasciclin domain-containing protein [Bacteroidota bacterium]|nr:fasciclin domain-containing protein [Bacteroidota bacterium]